MAEINSLTAMIFARGGSKGVPRKNIRFVAGKPLIAHSIECALSSRYIKEVVVSTDSEEIADVSRQYSAEVLMRPAELAADNSAEITAWRHAIESFPEVFDQGVKKPFISIPATSPLRASVDIDHAVERFDAGGCDIVFGVSPSHRNPYLNMVSLDENGLMKLVVEDGRKAFRRQDVPDVFDITTSVYVGDVNYIRDCERLIDGRVASVIIPVERSLDIDTEYDLYLADLQLSNPFKEV